VEGLRILREAADTITELAELAKEGTMLRNVAILCVDDDPAVLHTTELVLRSAGHLVFVASNVADAFLFLKAARFDMLLLDCVPGFAWLTVEAKRMHRNLRVAVCTGDPKCSELPFVDTVLHKPLPPRVLLDKIAELLAVSKAA
jgi:CheY-like chemotaxis protein